MHTISITVAVLAVLSGFALGANPAKAQSVSVEVRVQQPAQPAFYYYDAWGRIWYVPPRLAHEHIERQVIDRTYQ